MGRGGAFKNGLQFIGEDVEMVIGLNGDELTGEPLAPMVQFHVSKNASATLLLTHLVSPFGIVRKAADGRVTSFEEKPVLPDLISAGIYVLNRATITRFPDKGDHETTTFPELAAEGTLYSYEATMPRITVNSVKEYLDANKNIHEALPAYMLP